MKAVKIKSLLELNTKYQSYDVVAIDEGQFFNDIV
jgi:thymidine kinase